MFEDFLILSWISKSKVGDPKASFSIATAP